jgi:hypothetical protein
MRCRPEHGSLPVTFPRLSRFTKIIYDKLNRPFYPETDVAGLYDKVNPVGTYHNRFAGRGNVQAVHLVYPAEESYQAAVVRVRFLTESCNFQEIKPDQEVKVYPGFQN